MRTLFALVFAAFLLPLFALAAMTDLPAGFAPNSIWVSRTQITAGDTINIFTVVYNSSDAPLEGSVGFTVDGKPAGTRNFSVKEGGAQTESIPWTAVAGTHSIFARIEKISNADTSAAATVLNQTTDTITIVVKEAPPSATAQALSSVASVLQTGLASSTPIVMNAVQKLFDFGEVARTGAIEKIEKQIAKQQGEVPDDPIYNARETSASSSTASISSFIRSAGKGLLDALLFICKTSALFYALLAFVIFILFQLLRTWLNDRAK